MRSEPCERSLETPRANLKPRAPAHAPVAGRRGSRPVSADFPPCGRVHPAHHGNSTESRELGERASADASDASDADGNGDCNAEGNGDCNAEGPPAQMRGRPFVTRARYL
ncbi:hypothetical protein GCM10027056_26240 [Glaciibacter psychrotolerans]